LEIPQVWLPTVQEVLQADWQEVWQAPHSAVSSGLLRLPATIVLMCPVFFTVLPPHSMIMKESLASFPLF
jgi:hypothetical protein